MVIRLTSRPHGFPNPQHGFRGRTELGHGPNGSKHERWPVLLLKPLNADPTGMRAIAQAVGALRRAPLRRFSSAVTQSHAGRQVNHSVPAPAETLSLDSITMPHKVEAKFESQLEAAGSEPVNSDRNHQPLSQVHK